MSILVPAAVNYPSPLVALPSKMMNQEPPEGRMQIPITVDWATMGGANNCVAFNFQNNATLPMSKISALSVDNSDCGMDVRFVFPDTGETITVPALTPKLIIEIPTNGTSFYLVGTLNLQIEEPGDQTRFSILNYVPPPIAVPITTAQTPAGNGFLAVDGVATDVLLGASFRGSLRGFRFSYSSPQGGAVADGIILFKFEDGTGQDICWFSVTCDGTQVSNVQMVNMQDLNIRYSSGLVIKQAVAAGANPGGYYTYTILVTAP